MRGITDRQKEVLTFISTYTEENSYPPTVRDISNHFGISLRAVQDHILALQKKGFLSQSQKKARSIRVLSDCRDKEPETYISKVPLLGTVAAGKPLLSEENLDGSVLMKIIEEYEFSEKFDEEMIEDSFVDKEMGIIERIDKRESVMDKIREILSLFEY